MWRAGRSRKLSRSGERIDFNFSNFQAFQVPEGWDKLIVSIISVESGKTIAKSNKALVKNGNCQWTESLSESLWISDRDASKELEEHLFKLVVSMGSARSGILGEATVNMARFLSSRTSDPVSLPLKKCNFGTLLQVQIQCLTPRTKLRAELSRSLGSDAENQNVDDDEGTKSNASVVSVTRSIRSAISPSSEDLGSPSQPDKLESSYSASNSAENSSENERLYPKDNRAVVRYNNPIARQDSASSGSPHHQNYPLGEPPSTSNHSSFRSRITHSEDDLQNHEEEYGQSSSYTNAASSRDLLEAAEDTIEELRDEAKMWERNARKLMLDLDILKEKFSHQSKKLADMEIELSAAEKENNGMKKEVNYTKLLLEESMVKQKVASAGTTYQAEGASQIQRELEKEIKFQGESNAALALQLQRSQESNVELLFILRELEDTIEKEKEEMKDLQVVHLKVNELEKSIAEYLKEKSELQLELQELQESEKTLQSNMQILEQSLSDKIRDLEKERSSNRKYLSDLESEYRDSLSFKEEEIVNLEEKLSEYLREREEDRLDQMREMEALERKVRELERDCSELTDENLELLGKYKEAKKVIEENQRDASETFKLFSEISKQLKVAFHQVEKPWHNISSLVRGDCTACLELVSVMETDSKALPKAVFKCFSELNRLLEVRIAECEETLISSDFQIEERSRNLEEAQRQVEDYGLKIQELDSSIIELEATLSDLHKEAAANRAEMAEGRDQVEKLKARLLSKKEKAGFLKQSCIELESQVSDLTKEKDQLQEDMEIALRESNITSKCLDDLRNDLMVLSSSVDSHVSANKILERKSLELEKGKREVEIRLFEVEEENVQFSEQISALEAQLRYVTDEQESTRSDLETCRSLTTGLRDEIRRLTQEMETQERDLKQKLQDKDTRLSDIQEEYEYVKTENQKLQVSAEGLIDECNTLQKSYEEMRRLKVELQRHCSYLETELTEANRSLTVSSKSVEALEEKVTSMLEDFSSRENRLTSEVDALRQENWKLNEKITMEESLLNQMYVEKTAEIEELGMEVQQLQREVSALHEERERMAAEAAKEVSSLCADRAKLELAVKEFRGRVEFTEDELHTVRSESESKIQSLTMELAAVEESNEKLTAERAKLECAVQEFQSRVELTEDELRTVRIQSEEKNHSLTVELAAFKGSCENLTAERSKLESALKEFQSRVELTEDELRTVRTESESKIESLSIELAASKESYGKLTAEVAASKQNHEKRLKLLSGYRSREDKLKTAVNDLELKVTVSEYERQQLIEEAVNLKSRFQKTSQLEDEVLALKGKLDESKSEKEKLEASLHSISANFEELRAEKMSFVEKIFTLQKSMSEFEECKNNQMALEEKLSRLEGDLTAKEALYSQEAEIRTELTKLKRGNLQYQLKVQQLEGEKDECLKRAESLEQLLKAKQDQSNSATKKGNINFGSGNGTPYDEMDYVAKIELLEAELDEALNANSKYRTQLQRLSFEGKNSTMAGPRKLKGEGDLVPKERYERTKSSLETELKEIRDRYFQMSLKYAEVEAEREDLVMKLKSNKGMKKGSKRNDELSD